MTEESVHNCPLCCEQLSYYAEGLRFDKDNHWDPLVRNYAAEKYYELGK